MVKPGISSPKIFILSSHRLGLKAPSLTTIPQMAGLEDDEAAPEASTDEL